MKEKVGSDQLSVASKNPEDYFFRASAEDFKKIPGSPVAYWVSNGILQLYDKKILIGERAKKGLTTGDNEQFIRFCWEIDIDKFSVNSGGKWFPTQKGGQFRKWYGNFDCVLNWESDGRKIKLFKFPNGNLRSVVRNEKYYLESGITWTDVSSGKLSLRYVPSGFIINASGPTIFSDSNYSILAFLNSCIAEKISEFACPTIHFEVGQLQKFPLVEYPIQELVAVKKLVTLSKFDWNTYETSWDFTINPLFKTAREELDTKHGSLNTKLNKAYCNLRKNWQQTTLETQRLEEENNRIFIEAYGLQDELTPDVPLNEITLTCNPHYRYKGNKTEEELEALLLADTMKEFLSYGVGCMFGRYSLDKSGLILANQGETIEDYYRKLQEEPQTHTDTHGSERQKEKICVHPCSSVVQPTFEPDADNVIPILDGEWFLDDITSRFHEFLKVTFGKDHFDENLKFITDAIGKDIRKYFLKDFYKDHLKTYKKRPIYWLFASPKGSFNALIYMHRYRPDTVSVILNDYLREFRTKLQNAQENLEQLAISTDATKTEKTKALKQIEKLKKTITELDIYERDTLYPLATQNIEIDLDDGVKVNYKKFGKALKKVPGLSATK